MAYRIVDPNIACAFHDALPAVERCAFCQQRICDDCLQWQDVRPICRPCRGRTGSVLRRAARPVLAVGGGVVVLGLIVKFFLVYMSQLDPYGALLAEARKKHRQRPCDPEIAIELAYRVLQVDGRIDAEGAVFDDYLARGCPRHREVLSRASANHYLRGDDAGGRRLLDELIERFPEWQEGWLERARRSCEESGPAAAAADYQQAYKLDEDEATRPLLHCVKRASRGAGCPLFERTIAHGTHLQGVRWLLDEIEVMRNRCRMKWDEFPDAPPPATNNGER